MAVQNHSTNTNIPNSLKSKANLICMDSSNTISARRVHNSISLRILMHRIVEIKKSDPSYKWNTFIPQNAK